MNPLPQRSLRGSSFAPYNNLGRNGKSLREVLGSNMKGPAGYVKFVTIVTGFIGFMMQGGIGAVLAFYKQFAVIIIPSAIIVSLIFSYPVGKLATKVSGFDPNAALPADVE